MSIYFVVIIMIIAGIVGGIINYSLAPETPVIGAAARNIWRSLIVGIGATIMIPLFLEIAQSKLLDNIRNSKDLTMIAKTDSTAKKPVTDTTKTKSTQSKSETSNTDSDTTPPIKDYLLYAAYCLLAAAAGPRFINSLMNGILKDQQINHLTQQNNQITDEKNKIEQVQTLQTARNSLLAQEDEKTAIATAAGGHAIAAVLKPIIGPKTVPNDPQKGRFGGKREVNGRKLCASVTSLVGDALFKVKIWVESTDPARPISGDVIFYLHDTFRPSVITVPEAEIKDAKSSLETKVAWGAFTVGAVADEGLVLLEYDLAEDEAFPKAFRER